MGLQKQQPDIFLGHIRLVLHFPQEKSYLVLLTLVHCRLSFDLSSLLLFRWLLKKNKNFYNLQAICDLLRKDVKVVVLTINFFLRFLKTLMNSEIGKEMLRLRAYECLPRDICEIQQNIKLFLLSVYHEAQKLLGIREAKEKLFF